MGCQDPDVAQTFGTGRHSVLFCAQLRDQVHSSAWVDQFTPGDRAICKACHLSQPGAWVTGVIVWADTEQQHPLLGVGGPEVGRPVVLMRELHQLKAACSWLTGEAVCCRVLTQTSQHVRDESMWHSEVPYRCLANLTLTLL